MSRPLLPLKGHLRRKIEPPKPPKSKSPPLPDNPYRRVFYQKSSLWEMVEEKSTKMSHLTPGCDIFYARPSLQ